MDVRKTKQSEAEKRRESMAMRTEKARKDKEIVKAIQVTIISKYEIIWTLIGFNIHLYTYSLSNQSKKKTLFSFVKSPGHVAKNMPRSRKNLQEVMIISQTQIVMKPI
jgi:hypothetical protein